VTAPVYLSNGSLDQVVTLPLNLPQTFLPRRGQLAVGTFVLPEGRMAEVSWLSLHWIGLNQLTLPLKISAGLGAVFTGVYHGIETINRHTGHPMVYVPRELPGYDDSNPFGLHRFYEPGQYTILAVNNMSNIDVQLSVTFSAKIYTV
jgi:hypothetical protein